MSKDIVQYGSFSGGIKKKNLHQGEQLRVFIQGVGERREERLLDV